MSFTRAEKLIASFTSKEARSFDAVLNGQKRKTLSELYRLLQKNLQSVPEKRMDKEQLFAQLFGEPYDKSKDYILRHELRLLTEKLYAFFIRERQEQELRENQSFADMLLLKSLQRRGLVSEFENLFPKFYKRALEAHDYDNARKLNDLAFRVLIFGKEISKAVLQEAHERALEGLRTIKLMYRADVAVNQNCRMTCVESLRRMGEDIPQVSVKPDHDFEDIESSLISYFEQSTLAHQTAGEECLEHARAAVRHISSIADYYPKQTMTALAVLGSVNFAEHRYAEAKEVFGQAIAVVEKYKLTPRTDMLFNYSGTLMKLGEYREVLELMDEYRILIEADERVLFRFECYRCFCHIFLGNHALAYQAIPPNITQRPESEHQYFRFIYVILPYLLDDYENGLRETRNFLDYFNRHKDSLLFPKEKEAVLLFKRFYTILLDSTDRKEMQAKLADIREAIERFMEEAPAYRNYLWLLWLQNGVERHMEGELLSKRSG